jgi:hypothetical protein
MGKVLIFPHYQVFRAPNRSRRVEELEMLILDRLRILRHRESNDIVGEILQLRDEIWRVEAEEGETAGLHSEEH